MARKIVIAAAKKVAETKKEVLLEYSAPQANKVSVAGTFNNWDANSLSAKKDRKGNWMVKVALPQGKYEYKFVVDGSWLTDPHSKEVVCNNLGTQNSVLVVK